MASCRSVFGSDCPCPEELVERAPLAVGVHLGERLVEGEGLEVDLRVGRDAGEHLLDVVGPGQIRSASAWASSSVLPRIGETTNSTLQSSGLRPFAAMRARTSSRYSFIPSMPVATAMIESALRDANARPGGRSGLHEHRAALRRPDGVQRAPHR